VLKATEAPWVFRGTSDEVRIEKLCVGMQNRPRNDI